MSNIIEIKDFHASELDIYARLSEVQLLNKEKPEEGLFIAESPKVIERALDAGYEPVSLLVEEKNLKGETLTLLEKLGDVAVYVAESEVISQMTGFNLTRGALCAMRRKAYPAMEAVLKGTRRIAILENVMNPTNVGAIFRSAAALNMDAVLLTPASSNPLYRRASRVSMGTVFQVPWTYLGASPAQAPHVDLGQLKVMGFKTLSMALREDSLSIRDPRLAAEERLAIILGTEGDGLADRTIEGCDYTVRIPMSHGVDSLNVAAASAVAFFQLGNT